MTDQANNLNELSLKDFSHLYASLAHDAGSTPQGIYRGTYVGPGWLRATAGPSMILSGMRGWWGKQFKDDGTAVNLLQQGGVIKPGLPMNLVTRISHLDGKSTLALLYGDDSPFPWPYIADELRPLAENAYLGMMCLSISTLPTLSFPFLLESHGPVAGL